MSRPKLLVGSAIALLSTLVFITFKLALAATIITVNTTVDENGANPAACSLHEAILALNNGSAFGGCTTGDTIHFALGAGTPSIALTDPLPTIVKPVVMDGHTGGATRVELDGHDIFTPNSNGLAITAGNSTLSGLVLNNFGGDGLVLSTAGGNTIINCYIGLDAAGTTGLGNDGAGILIDNVANNVIGGAPGEGNVIGDNGGDGIKISGVGATGNIVKGNLIGTDAGGVLDLGNAGNGVYISSGSGNTIGGTTATARNVIAGNESNGVLIDGGGATGNLVQGNYIGADASGAVALGNTQNGVEIIGAPNNTISGIAAARSVIAGNGVSGIVLFNSGATGNLVQGNYIGVAASGVAAIGNAKKGVEITGAPNNTIGGAAAGTGNLISGNAEDGIYILNSGASGNTIQGNYIGTDAGGMAKLGNTATGITVDAAPNTIIGGATAGARNIVSGNDDVGICLINGATGSMVQGNYAGVAADGVTSLGNKRSGVLFRDSNITIGGASAGEANIIAYNQDKGVTITTGSGNQIRANSIFSNTNLGIDLGVAGITANDDGDNDAGANNLQNFPLLSSAASAGASTLVTGTLNSKPNANFTIEFFSNIVCDGAGNGEGQTFLGAQPVTTDGAGKAEFTFTTATLVPIGYLITATTTDAGQNTSEFSRCQYVTAPGVPTPTVTPTSPTTGTPTPTGTLTPTLTPTPTGTQMPQNPVYLPYIQH